MQGLAKVGERALERVKGIEPSYAAWEAAVLPLNYTRSPSRTSWRMVVFVKHGLQPNTNRCGQ